MSDIRFRLALIACAPLALTGLAVEAQTAGPGQPFAGTGEIPRGIGDLDPPDFSAARPIETPELADPSALGAMAREVLGEDDLRARYGTIIRGMDGSETRRDASDDVMRALMAGEETPRGLFVDEPESVPGPLAIPETARSAPNPADPRVQVTDTSTAPLFQSGQLVMLFDGGMQGTCSGSLIGPHTVLTAGHCLWSSDGGWPNEIYFLPGAVAEGNYPFGVHPAASIAVLPGYVELAQQNRDDATLYDMALVTLRDPVGQYLGYMGITTTNQIAGFDAHLLSYPADKPPSTMWYSSCAVAFFDGLVAPQVFIDSCRSFQGSSGGNLFALLGEEAQTAVMGVRVAGVPGGGGPNVSVRLHEPYFNWIAQNWR